LDGLQDNVSVLGSNGSVHDDSESEVTLSYGRSDYNSDAATPTVGSPFYDDDDINAEEFAALVSET
jgi:hypothetical protein